MDELEKLEPAALPYQKNWKLSARHNQGELTSVCVRNARLQSRRMLIQKSDLRDWSRAFRTQTLVRTGVSTLPMSTRYAARDTRINQQLTTVR